MFEMDKFEEALQQHKDNLSKNLSEFGEGHRLNRMHREIDSKAADYEYYFNAGQQSQQAKVEELQKRVQFLEQELGAWKGKSIAAMINGMCKQCGKEPWQAIVSDKDGYALLHCFGCGANKYELVGEQALKGEGQ